MRSLWNRWRVRCYGQAVVDAQSRIREELAEAEREVANSWNVAFLRGLSQDLSAILWMSKTPR